MGKPRRQLRVKDPVDVPLAAEVARQKADFGLGPHFQTHAPHKKAWRLQASILVAPIPRDHLFGMPILSQITSDDVLYTAYEWLCRRRRDHSANSDVWALRRCWPREKEQIKA